MKKETKLKKEKKTVAICSIILLLLVMLISIILINTKNNDKTISTEKPEKQIFGSYMAEEIQKLMNEDDENLVSNKYLITDNTIERIRENTKVEDFKKEFEKEVKIYKDEALTEEVTEGIIKTGMVLEERGDKYNLVVTGDVNKDGFVDQIDISKIIRNETEDLPSKRAAEIGMNKIESKIVFGKFELQSVKEVIIPEIEVVSGEVGKNDWYTTDVTIKINQKDKEGTKTVYKLKGTEEKEVTEISEGETITLNKDGVYKVVAYTYGEDGNKSRIAQRIIKINKTGIEATIKYTPDTETTDLVTATVTFNKEDIIITNNEGKNTYEFTENGEFTFTYEDEMGRTGTITAKVDWIKQKEKIGQDGEWKYFVNKDNTIQLTRYLGSKKEVTVPAVYDGYEVYAVGSQYATETPKTCYNVFGEKTLSNSTITKITIENGIKKIKTGAFFGCSKIKGDLIIPDSVTIIGYAAFANCKGINGNLILSKNLKEIHYGAFNGCSNINGSLNLPDNLEIIGDYAFNKCSGLTGNLKIPDNITEIGISAFQNCSGFNGTLTLSENLTKIGNYAFNKCSGLTGNLVIPNSVTEIGRTAFQNCSGLTGNIVIPEKIEVLNDYTFYGCKGFNGTLTLPLNLKSIGSQTFDQCSNLTGDIIIPDNVTEIGSGAFQNCKGFNGTITLSKKLVSIGEGAFNQCNGLTGDLIIPDSVSEIGGLAFQCLYSATGKLQLPKNIKNIGRWAFYDDKFTGILELPEGLETLGEAAFGKNTNFENTTVVIPSTLKKIGQSCNFYGEDLGLSTHDFYNFGANAGNFETFEVSEGNGNFIAVNGVLYTKNKKRLIAYPKNKKDDTYEILEGVVTLDELSIASNMKLKTLIIPDSLSMEIRDKYIRVEGKSAISSALYNYNTIQNIQIKDTNPNYKSVDGVVYTKDLKELVYISSGRTNEIIIPDSVKKIRDEAIFVSQVSRKITRLYIPAGMVDISDETVNKINQFTINVEVAEDNAVFTVDANNKLIKK